MGGIRRYRLAEFVGRHRRWKERSSWFLEETNDIARDKCGRQYAMRRVE
jgi:hypothetical protein